MPENVLTGTALETALDALKLPEGPASKLDKNQKLTQQITGDLKYFERGTMPAISRHVHRLSCVMSNPPPEALQAAVSTLALAYKLRESCLTYGGDRVKRTAPVDGHIEMSLDDGAPSELERVLGRCINRPTSCICYPSDVRRSSRGALHEEDRHRGRQYTRRREPGNS